MSRWILVEGRRGWHLECGNEEIEEMAVEREINGRHGERHGKGWLKDERILKDIIFQFSNMNCLKILGMDDSEDGTLLPDKDYNAVFQVLEEKNVSITELLTVLLTDQQFKNHPVLDDLLGNAGAVVTQLLHHRQLSHPAQDQICAGVEHIYAKEIVELVKASSGWHFSTHQASQGDLDLSSWEHMAQSFTVASPRMWSLLDTLLLAWKHKDSLILNRDAMLVNGPDSRRRQGFTRRKCALAIAINSP
ncbi:hypothetical protein F5887DRAFT_923228 [Amanita rubescens]|nr:hypothetical protein F5887DRAFT_923228 [Amanita rubescens]